MRDWSWELSSCKRAETGEFLVFGFKINKYIGEGFTFGEAGPENTRNLLDESFRCEKCVVFFGKFLDEFLILVQPEVVSSALTEG